MHYCDSDPILGENSLRIEVAPGATSVLFAALCQANFRQCSANSLKCEVAHRGSRSALRALVNLPISVNSSAVTHVDGCKCPCMDNVKRRSTQIKIEFAQVTFTLEWLLKNLEKMSKDEDHDVDGCKCQCTHDVKKRTNQMRIKFEQVSATLEKVLKNLGCMDDVKKRTQMRIKFEQVIANMERGYKT
ncbi:hypothetical protein XELAEV_18038814mg [Xenopus laevis]|uniref:Uncharacterized protein n=1 Tax=Xenopus laevis TaxID=8355 RepID=A0A974C7V5_XENLA|nr:hypothetical protein XELAEV_18038814mg [Xenopus laevis]